MNLVPLTPVQLEIERKLEIPPRSLTQNKLLEWQLAQLNRTLNFVKTNSPYYREKLSSLPAQLSDLSEIQLFPFTTAEDLSYDGSRMVCVSQNNINRVVTLETSGTTGHPKRLFFTREDQNLTIDFFGAGMSTLIEPGYKVLILLPGKTPGSVGNLLQTGIERIGSTGIQHGPFSDPFETNNRIEALQIDTLVGAPKQVFTLIRAWQIAKKRTCPIRSILLSTDYAAPSLMKEIKRVWGCRVLQHYGMTEAGLGVGIDCAAGRGFHLREADLFFELIDADGKIVPEGEKGEVVLTTLTRKAMPLIRYRTKDLSRIIPGVCSCGTVLMTYEWIQNRIDGREKICSMPRLDDLIFEFPFITGFDAALANRELRLDLYWTAEVEHLKSKEIREKIISAFPDLCSADIMNHTGFPDSAFDLRKKRISVTF